MTQYSLWQMIQYFFPDFAGNIPDPQDQTFPYQNEFHSGTGLMPEETAAWGDFNFDEWASDFARYLPTKPDFNLMNKLLREGTLGDLESLYGKVSGDIDKLTKLNAMSDFSSVSAVPGSILNKYAADKTLEEFNLQSKKRGNIADWHSDMYSAVGNLVQYDALGSDTLQDYTPDWAPEDYEFGSGCNECPEDSYICPPTSGNPCGCWNSSFETPYDEFCNG